jgi:cytosine deaminase
MDLVIRNARTSDEARGLVDIGVVGSRIAAIEPSLDCECETIDAGGKLVSPSFVETHIHLDKSCILDRCTSEQGDIEEAIRETSRQKKQFTAEDVYERGKRTLEKSILQGTGHMRTHVEVDPGVELRGLEGVRQLAKDYRWAADIQICVFPQEGLLNNPGTDELLVAALRDGASAIGGAPYMDSNPHGQIDRIFELAREFDVDIDMHLDFGPDPDNLDLEYVCTLCERFKRGGRTAIGHVTKLSCATPERFVSAGRRLADAGVALTVLPSTDLFLMGRHMDHSVMRGVTHAHRLLKYGVNCSLSTNNVLNPFTPFGDCSLVRMANLNANVCQIGSRHELCECMNMISTRSAKLMNIEGYGLEVGRRADFVILDCQSPHEAVCEVSQVLFAFKGGVKTVSRKPANLHRPH